MTLAENLSADSLAALATVTTEPVSPTAQAADAVSSYEERVAAYHAWRQGIEKEASRRTDSRGQTVKPWDKDTTVMNPVRAYGNRLFLGGELEPGDVPPEILDKVWFGFALTCTKEGITGAPGQLLDRYAKHKGQVDGYLERLAKREQQGSNGQSTDKKGGAPKRHLQSV